MCGMRMTTTLKCIYPWSLISIQHCWSHYISLFTTYLFARRYDSFCCHAIGRLLGICCAGNWFRCDYYGIDIFKVKARQQCLEIVIQLSQNKYSFMFSSRYWDVSIPPLCLAFQSIELLFPHDLSIHSKYAEVAVYSIISHFSLGLN